MWPLSYGNRPIISFLTKFMILVFTTFSKFKTWWAKLHFTDAVIDIVLCDPLALWLWLWTLHYGHQNLFHIFGTFQSTLFCLSYLLINFKNGVLSATWYPDRQKCNQNLLYSEFNEEMLTCFRYFIISKFHGSHYS